ncbi:MAG TPA: hypothetical protein VFL57_02635 [Bryobacteraceae bacterium]|nr:hypothetical protein [Bryobacteraceae bacterium]
MALFTDGLICGSEDLREYESSILEVARNESIELTPKLRVAQREIAFELITFLMRHGPEHVDARRGLTNVIVTNTLRHWHAMQSLAAVYRDAYHQRMNDRYKEKWARYSLETRTAKETCFTTGIGISLSPIPRATAPVCDSTSGGQLPSRTYLVAVNWRRGTQAGELSLPLAVEVAAGRLLQVRIEGTPSNIEGWCVFVGRDAERLYEGSSQALPLTEVWTESGDPFAGKPITVQAQSADLFVRLDRRINRG